MKVLYVVLALIILVGLIFFVNNSPDIAYEVETDTDIESAVEDEQISTGKDSLEEEQTETESGVNTEDQTAGFKDKGGPETKTFTLSGVNFAYDVTEIKVNEGDTVTINFESAEGFHDWVVDEFDAATEKVKPGTPTSVTFVADKAGTYEYYCSVGSHRASGMVGTLIVE